MAKVWERGGVRLQWSDEGVTVYVDADKLAGGLPIDTPEVALVTIGKDDIEREGGRLWKNMKAELQRIKKRMIRRKGAKKK